MRLPLVLLVLSISFALGGCMEVEEDWTFDEKGGGIFALTVRWNADLWRRVGDVLGPKIMARLAGRGFPLRPQQWEDGLKGLGGVEILELGETDTDTGLRQLSVKLRFRRLEDLLRWEVLAGRRVRVEMQGERPKPGEKKPQPIVRVHMEPIARVPVLDRIAALLEAIEKPPPKAEGEAAARDPHPLERLGIEKSAAEMVWRMVKLPLDQVKLRVRFHLPNDVVSVRGSRTLREPREVSFDWDFAALRKRDTDRTVRFRWQMRAFDEAPVVDHRGAQRARPPAKPR